VKKELHRASFFFVSTHLSRSLSTALAVFESFLLYYKKEEENLSSNRTCFLKQVSNQEGNKQTYFTFREEHIPPVYLVCWVVDTFKKNVLSQFHLIVSYELWQPTPIPIFYCLKGEQPTVVAGINKKERKKRETRHDEKCH
jgi:hypothetical protein